MNQRNLVQNNQIVAFEEEGINIREHENFFVDDNGDVDFAVDNVLIVDCVFAGGLNNFQVQAERIGKQRNFVGLLRGKSTIGHGKQHLVILSLLLAFLSFVEVAKQGDQRFAGTRRADDEQPFADVKEIFVAETLLLQGSKFFVVRPISQTTHGVIFRHEYTFFGSRKISAHSFEILKPSLITTFKTSAAIFLSIAFSDSGKISYGTKQGVCFLTSSRCSP